MTNRLRTLGVLMLMLARIHAAHYDVDLPPGTTEIVVAAGDSITIDVHAAGTAITRWNCGTLREPFEVRAHQQLDYEFEAPGAYEIDVVDVDGEVIAHGLARVVAVSMPSRIAAEIGFRRELRIPIDASGAPVRFSSTDPSLLAVETVDIGNDAVVIAATPLAHGDAAIVALIDAPAGEAVVDAREVDEFTIDSLIADGFTYDRDEDGFGHGVFGFRMTPRLDYCSVTVDFFVPTMSVNGRTYFTVPGTELDADGLWTADFTLSPNTDKSCHRFIVDQPEQP